MIDIDDESGSDNVDGTIKTIGDCKAVVFAVLVRVLTVVLLVVTVVFNVVVD